MQRKVSSTVQMIHHQLKVPRLLVALSAQPCSPGCSVIAANISVYRILRTISMARDLSSRFTGVVINIRQYTSVGMIRIKQ